MPKVVVTTVTREDVSRVGRLLEQYAAEFFAIADKMAEAKIEEFDTHGAYSLNLIGQRLKGLQGAYRSQLINTLSARLQSPSPEPEVKGKGRARKGSKE